MSNQIQLVEVYDSTSKILNEGNDRSYYIEGIFMEAERENRNGRVYPLNVLQSAVEKYQREWIDAGRAVGELGHGTHTGIDFDRVSHKIIALEFRGNQVWGKAKLIDTKPGKIAKVLVDEGIRFGVSTKGIGSVKRVRGKDIVQDDLEFSSVDLVADPSCKSAMVSAICESFGMKYSNGNIILPTRKKMTKLEEQALNEIKFLVNRF